MSAFTEYERADGQVEVYASTNKFMRFAIEVMDAGYTPIINSHNAITQWYNNLLPVELKEIAYLPAEKMMRDWINLFFSNNSRGLVNTTPTGTRYHIPIPATGCIGWRCTFVRRVGRLFASGRYDRPLTFLSWFPQRLLLLDNIF